MSWGIVEEWEKGGDEREGKKQGGRSCNTPSR